MKRFFTLSCTLFLPLVLLLSACSSAPEGGGGGGGGSGGTDGGPTITSFEADPPSISVGGSSTLTWEVSGATSLALRRSVDDEITDLSNVAGNSFVVTPLETTAYTLEATNAQGTTADDVEVEVVSEELTQLGFINLSEQKPPSGAAQTAASGIFLEFTEGQELPDTFFNNPFEGNIDTCDVTSTMPENGEGDPNVLPPFAPEGIPAYISAGAQVTLVAGSSTYATLDKMDTTVSGETVTFYSANALGAPPAELTATVPGDAFPAFTEVALPTASSFTLTAPAGSDPITLTTTFTWDGGDAGSDADAVVLISVSEFDPESGGTVSVTCIAQDDGSFIFPAETQGALGDSFEGSLTSAGRQAYRTEIKGDAVLVLGASSSQFFGPLPTGTKASFWTSQF